MDSDEDMGFDIVSGNAARCAVLTYEASAMEQQAMNMDRMGQPHCPAAAEFYKATHMKLLEALNECPIDHQDRETLQEHTREVGARASYLANLNGSEPTIPLEEHIAPVTLSLGQDFEVLRNLKEETSSNTTADGTKIMGAAAAIGSATGLLLMGPVSAVALGFGAAYASTREDKAGSAARKIGKAGVKAVHFTKKINDEYRLSSHALAYGQSALDQVAMVGTRCGLTDRAVLTTQALNSWNEKHKVTHTLGRGLSTAGSALSGLVWRTMPPLDDRR
mmetsp:Transcript_45529/g.97614  ORF Transcript_45529/g.97614 Transcript_45529/m.97614 type:complete len:277 (+) Transcript_45529:245-1075(+)